MGRASRAARDWALVRDARRVGSHEILWDEETTRDHHGTLKAAE
jgi:multidrug efflux pump